MNNLYEELIVPMEALQKYIESFDSNPILESISNLMNKVLNDNIVTDDFHSCSVSCMDCDDLIDLEHFALLLRIEPEDLENFLADNEYCYRNSDDEFMCLQRYVSSKESEFFNVLSNSSGNKLFVTRKGKKYFTPLIKEYFRMDCD